MGLSQGEGKYGSRMHLGVTWRGRSVVAMELGGEQVGVDQAEVKMVRRGRLERPGPLGSGRWGGHGNQSIGNVQGRGSPLPEILK